MEYNKPLEYTDLNRIVRSLRIGKQLRIPAEYNDGVACKATVQAIYPHVVSFQREDGTRFALGYVDTAKVIKMQARMDAMRDEEMETDDIFQNMR
jgi:hypothetical protein